MHGDEGRNGNWRWMGDEGMVHGEGERVMECYNMETGMGCGQFYPEVGQGLWAMEIGEEEGYLLEIVRAL